MNLSLLILLLGLLMWILFSHPKFLNSLLSDMGRIMFQCGLLAYLLTGAGLRMIHVP